jgi:hypothetical protein
VSSPQRCFADSLSDTGTQHLSWLLPRPSGHLYRRYEPTCHRNRVPRYGNHLLGGSIVHPGISQLRRPVRAGVRCHWPESGCPGGLCHLHCFLISLWMGSEPPAANCLPGTPRSRWIRYVSRITGENIEADKFLGLYSLTMIILPEVAPLNYQGVVSSLIGIVLAASGVLGPLIGGVLTQYASWRWVFWIKFVIQPSSCQHILTLSSGPIGGVSAVAFYFIWPKPEYLPSFQRRKWKEVDFLGAFLL